MKRRNKFLVVLGVLLVLGGIAAWKWKSILFAYVEYSVRNVTASLPHCDRVEVFHLKQIALDESDRPKPGEGFPKGSHSDAAIIVGRTTLRGVDAEALAALWRAQTFGVDLQMLCHSPAYGFRYYSGDKMVFETSLCFHCSNFYVTTFNEAGCWGFDADSPKAQELSLRLQEILPESVPKYTLDQLNQSPRIRCIFSEGVDGKPREIMLTDAGKLTSVRAWIQQYAWPPRGAHDTGNATPRGYFVIFEHLTADKPAFVIRVYGARNNPQPDRNQVKDEEWEKLLSIFEPK